MRKERKETDNVRLSKHFKPRVLRILHIAHCWRGWLCDREREPQRIEMNWYQIKKKHKMNVLAEAVCTLS